MISSKLSTKAKKPFRQSNIPATTRSFNSLLWTVSRGKSVNDSVRALRKEKRKGVPALISCSLICCNNTWRDLDYLEPKSAPRDKYLYFMFLPTSFTFQRQYVEACISYAVTWDQGCHPGAVLRSTKDLSDYTSDAWKMARVFIPKLCVMKLSFSKLKVPLLTSKKN